MIKRFIKWWKHNSNMKRIKNEYKRVQNDEPIRMYFIYHSDRMYYWRSHEGLPQEKYEVKVNLLHGEITLMMEIDSCSDDPEGFGSNDIWLKALGVKGEKPYKDMTLEEFIESSLNSLYKTE